MIFSIPHISSHAISLPSDVLSVWAREDRLRPLGSSQSDTVPHPGELPQRAGKTLSTLVPVDELEVSVSEEMLVPNLSHHFTVIMRDFADISTWARNESAVSQRFDGRHLFALDELHSRPDDCAM